MKRRAVIFRPPERYRPFQRMAIRFHIRNRTPSRSTTGPIFFPSRHDVGRHGPKIGRTNHHTHFGSPHVPGGGRGCPKFGRTPAQSGQSWPVLVAGRIWRGFGQNQTEVGQIGENATHLRSGSCFEKGPATCNSGGLGETEHDREDRVAQQLQESYPARVPEKKPRRSRPAPKLPNVVQRLLNSFAPGVRPGPNLANSRQRCRSSVKVSVCSVNPGQFWPMSADFVAEIDPRFGDSG